MNFSSRSMTLGLTAVLLLGAAGAGRAGIVSASLPHADEATRAHVAESFGKLPLYFVENRGQLDARVAYYVQGSDKTVYFTDQGLTFALHGQPERWALKLDFVGARSGARPEGQEPTGATFSYFKGSRSQWQAGLESYGQIVYRDLWPGIDLVYAGTVNRMKYTFVVKPGADPDQIELAWRGAGGVALNAAGELAVTTPAGGFTDERPVSWQESNGRQVMVATSYRLAANRKAHGRPSASGSVAYGFEVGEYDRHRELVIDPAVLIYAGFIGSSSTDLGNDIAVDGAGNAYVAGSSYEATDFPVTAGPDLTPNARYDAFVVKVNAAGTALVYAGFIGGAGTDRGNSIAVDGAGNAYVTGSAGSDQTSFPVTVGPDLTFNSDSTFQPDAFVAKVNADGTALEYCGYIGGSSVDEGNAIAVDGAGNAYVAGSAVSTETSFPVTVGPDLTFNGGFGDGFVAKVNAAGTALDYCSYIGGDGTGALHSNGDHATGIAVDGAGNAYVTGRTDSSQTSFPVTVGPDLTFNGGYDAFVAKIDASGTAFLYAGFLGGMGRDEGSAIAVDSEGNAYAVGFTSSDATSFPATAGPDLTLRGILDAYVAKVNASGTAFLYAGYIGGYGFETASSIAVDGAGNAYVTGFTNSDETSFPATAGPDLTYNGDITDEGGDGFVARIDASGTAFDYCGYIGGSSSDEGRGIAVDSAGNAYVIGNTSSDETSFPVTAGPDLTFNGEVDTFVVKINYTSDDRDGDGIVDNADNCPEVANPGQIDGDGDGIGDACDTDNDGDGVLAGDNCPLTPNADQADADLDGSGDACDLDDDDDGVLDDVDNCPLDVNADQADLDADNLGDACDADLDGDGVVNGDDNCSLMANPGQDNADGDSEGDACDLDDDNDGVLDGGDNCSLIANPGQQDLDQDGVGDACDGDLDGDGVANGFDNCPVTANSDQLDFDADGAGDTCDTDIDGDGILNGADVCGLTPGGVVVDTATGCSIDQLCPCAGPRGTTQPWRNHGQYVSSVAKTSQSFVQQGLITAAEKDAIVSAAASSSCGQ